MRPMQAETVHAAFAEAARRWPDRPFLNVLPETAAIYGIESGELSYGDAAARVETIQAAYRAAGIEPGHRVMLLLENRPAFFLHWVALNGLSASVVPLNPDLRAAEQAYMIGHARPALAVAIAARVDELRGAAEQAGSAMAVADVDAGMPQVTVAPVFDASGPGRAREAAMLYTSGTTGQPKGCVLANEYFLMSGQWYEDMQGICALRDGDRMITPLPIFHMNAMACSFMGMMAVGGCLTALDRFHPRSWWADVRDSGATCLHYLGVMPSMLMGSDAQPADRDHKVRFGFGAGVDPKLHAAFEERFGFPLTESWAMTETGAASAITSNLDPRRVGEACFGRPGPEVEIRIVDDAGQDVVAGLPGELLIRRSGPNPRAGFFVEYYKNPQATEEAWEGGWFHTGDIVRQEASGDMFFVDRKKNVIRRSGENIAAVEVESVLMRHPEIAAVGIAAVPDEIRGDEVFACIVPKGMPSADLAREIVRWALDQIAYYKVPGHIAFVDELPLTATQKIQRAALKTRAIALLDDPATVNTTKLKKRQIA
ncbi:AMP-binding protein [Rhodobacteraceae bacterium F11138]|nr:AMP-binding protein [Rhodobacteraceae bacterium F11138]